MTIEYIVNMLIKLSEDEDKLNEAVASLEVDDPEAFDIFDRAFGS